MIESSWMVEQCRAMVLHSHVMRQKDTSVTLMPCQPSWKNFPEKVGLSK